MIGLLLLLLGQDSRPPTAGDTVWIARALGDVAGAAVRPQPWALEPLGVQLGPAEVTHGTGGAVVRYPVVIWYPGDQVLTMPGPVLVRADGTSDTLPASTHRVRLLSVLPAGEPKAQLAPRPPSAPVRLSARSPLPLGLLLLLWAAGVTLAALRWRRRGKLVARPSAAPAEPDPALLRRWAEAGEYRAALSDWGWRLARRMAGSTDLAEIRELQRLLEELAAMEFRPEGPKRLAALVERAAALEAD